MSTSTAATPDEYITSLPDDRRAVVSEVAAVIRRNLPPGYAEGMQYGMIGWYVPLETFPDTYNGQPLGLAALASQKQYISLYLNNVYGDGETEAWFRKRWAQTGKPLNMGKSCVRFRRLEDVPLDVIGETIARTDLASFLHHYQEARGTSRATRANPWWPNPYPSPWDHGCGPASATASLVPVTLAEWITEYRRVDPDDLTRPEVDVVDDWADVELMAPADRLHDTKPRWMERARIVGYGPPGWR